LVDELRAEQGRQRESFSADLAKSQETVERANSRADHAERRAMLEIDQERQAKARSDKQVEILKAQVGQLETQIREREHAETTETASQRAALERAEQARQVLQAANEALRIDAQAGIGELQTLQESVIRLSAQNATLQSMIDRFDVRPAPPANRPVRGPRELKRKT
jgi:DNA repair exonuclease SbcCD ATPase subunit